MLWTTTYLDYMIEPTAPGLQTCIPCHTARNSAGNGNTVLTVCPHISTHRKGMVKIWHDRLKTVKSTHMNAVYQDGEVALGESGVSSE